MDDLLALLNEYRIIVGALLTVFLTAVALWKWWDRVSFWWLRVMVHLPVIGKIARLSRNLDYDRRTGWFQSEQEICAAFLPYYESARPDSRYFDDCLSYLRKVQELGRNPLSLWGWLLLAVLVFLEALGFSYVLAGYTIPGASEALQEKGALAIAFLIATIMVFFTHWAGHELHHNTLVKKVRTWYTTGGETRHPMVPNTRVSLDNEHVDDDEPAWRQLLNRLPANASVTPGYKVTGLTLFLILFIAVGATYVRGQVLETTLIEQHNPENAVDYPGPYDGIGVPPEIRRDQEKVDAEIKEETEESERKGGWATFIILAIVFVFLQIIGILTGMKTGFAGKESAKAHRVIGHFGNGDEFVAFHERKRNRVARLAQMSLGKLQGRMLDRAASVHIDGKAHELLRHSAERDFHTYVRDRSRAEKRADDPVTPVAGEPASPGGDDGTEPDEAQVLEWMEKFGWDRARTLRFLRDNMPVRPGRRALTEEEALELLLNSAANRPEPGAGEDRGEGV